ncbi:hypothetical protein, partial [Bacillus velezensis]|uniref:hypothetical protein n=1 Tax=Bacillus velezensis TaxID=492670 RepID=UPI0020BD7547
IVDLVLGGPYNTDSHFFELMFFEPLLLLKRIDARLFGVPPPTVASAAEFPPYSLIVVEMALSPCRVNE